MTVELRRTSALSEAVTRGDRFAVARLLDEGHDPNELDAEGLAPLFRAVAPFGGDLAMVELLVDAGANVNARSPEGHDLARYCLDAVSSNLEHARAVEIVRYLERRGLGRR